jgi:hypothetical protein
MPTPTAVVLRESGFIVAPITTELHRLGRSRADAEVWVVLRLRDSCPLNVDLLRDTLTSWPRAGVGKVYFHVTCVTEPGQEPSVGIDWSEMKPVIWRHEMLIQYGLRGAAREAGFGEAVVSVCGSGPDELDWDAVCADFEAHAASDLVAEESGVGDDLVQVYPVRTSLSRSSFLNANCVVYVKPPPIPMTADALAEIEERAIRYVEQLRPERRQGVCFSFEDRVPVSPEDEEQKQWLKNANSLLQRFTQDPVWKERMRFASWASVVLA